MHASFLHYFVLHLTVCSTVTILYPSTLPVHTVNHTPHLKTSNHFSFQTQNCSEQFCTAYNVVSRVRTGKCSKMQNILERNSTQTYFSLMSWWHSYFESFNVWDFFFPIPLSICHCYLLSCVEQNLTSGSESQSVIWKFRNSK